MSSKNSRLRAPIIVHRQAGGETLLKGTGRHNGRRWRKQICRLPGHEVEEVVRYEKPDPPPAVAPAIPGLSVPQPLGDLLK